MCVPISPPASKHTVCVSAEHVRGVNQLLAVPLHARWKNIQLTSVGSEKAAKVLTPSGCIAGKRRVWASVLAWGAQVDRRGRGAAKRIYLRLGRGDGHEPWSDTDQWIIQVCSARDCVLFFRSWQVKRPALNNHEPCVYVCVRVDLLSWDFKRFAAESSMWFLFFIRSDWTRCANSDFSLLADWVKMNPWSCTLRKPTPFSAPVGS